VIFFRNGDQQNRVTVTYTDNEQSAKIFIRREQADKFAARKTKSPVVKSASVVKLD